MCSSMEGTESYSKHKKLVTSEQKQPNPSKFYHHFLFKAALVIALLFILPLFPQQAPEFVNQNLITRSWELLHLLLVGIAISYGLFSRRNEETEKDNSNFKFDNAQSYVSRLFQVSSVFDDEAESPTGSEPFDENKVQTWSSHYYRNESMVVVAKETSVLKKQSANTFGERPLLLPIRSLKSRVSDPDSLGSVSEASVISGSNSKPSSRRFSSKTINGEYGGIEHDEIEHELKESIVLPSPIPWRSRSGRMEMKEDIDSPPPYSLPPSMEESRVSKTHVSRSSLPNSASSSPKLSPSPSLSSPRKLSPSNSSLTESQTKSTEDMLKRKVLNKSSPPPAPPPPPKMFYKSSSLSPSSTYNHTSLHKDFRRSSISEPKDTRRMNYGADLNPRNQFDGSPMENSVRKMRASKMVSDREMENKGRKKVGYDRTSYSAENMGRFRIPRTPKQSFEEFTENEEEEEEEEEEILMESDEDSDQSEDDDVVGESLMQKNVGKSTKQIVKNEEAACSNSVSDGPPDVDKKADEFIAKFREQIGLQRIESIKITSGDMNWNLSRYELEFV